MKQMKSKISQSYCGPFKYGGIHVLDHSVLWTLTSHGWFKPWLWSKETKAVCLKLWSAVFYGGWGWPQA